MTVYVERQIKDKSFAVYLGGDADPEGNHDRLFSYGDLDGHKVTVNEARGAALNYALPLAKKFGGLIEKR